MAEIRDERKPGVRYVQYVNMVDNFMSGWGAARGGVSRYSVACESFEEAAIVEANARRRGDMKRVVLSNNPPRARGNDHLAIVTKEGARRWFEPGAFRDDA